ncbi:MAG TPA: sulfite exporter TauE/SafE family protein, partial [Bryobacteraceae bacterium]
MRFLALLAAAIVGGAVNALAGGGTFLVFPALLLARVAPITANATASFLLWPAGLASAWVYRKDIPDNRRLLAVMSVVSIVGSAIGSLVLLRTSNSTFEGLVPWLLLFATLNFTFAKQMRELSSGASRHASRVALVIGQLIISFYGGYFGAGMGVLMLALYLATTGKDVHVANGLRLVCGVAINGVAIVIFGARGAIDWRLGIPMLVAALIGGYFGAVLVRRMNAETAR